MEEETGCRFAKPPDKLRHNSDLKGWLLDWIGKADDQETAWALMLMYGLWLARNDARDNKQVEDPQSIAKRAAAGLEE